VNPHQRSRGPFLGERENPPGISAYSSSSERKFGQTRIKQSKQCVKSKKFFKKQKIKNKNKTKSIWDNKIVISEAGRRPFLGERENPPGISAYSSSSKRKSGQTRTKQSKQCVKSNFFFLKQKIKNKKQKTKNKNKAKSIWDNRIIKLSSAKQGDVHFLGRGRIRQVSLRTPPPLKESPVKQG